MCVCPSVFPSDNTSKSEPILMIIPEAKFEDEQNRSSGFGETGKKVVKKVVKKCQIGVPEKVFEKFSRNMTDTEKMMMTKL